MSFFDDLLKKIGASLATRYGVVASGEFEGCGIAFGNPPKTKMETPYSFSQMIFLKDKEEAARLVMAKTILDVEYVETIQFPKTGMDGYRCKITFEDGKTVDIDLFPSKVRAIYQILRGFMRNETADFFKAEIEKLPQA